MPGLGSTIAEWVIVKLLVTPFARWLEYDRSGLGRSEAPVEPPEEISAASVAADLDALLKVAGVAPPYVIVAHSWGGFTSREFIHLQEKNVAGIVLVDTVTEFSNVRKTIISRPTYVQAMDKGIDLMAISSLGRDRKLSTEEWEALEKENESPKTTAISAAELKGFFKDAPVLAAKKQLENQILGNRPVSVLAANNAMDIRDIYEAGIAAGNRTEEERVRYRALVDGLTVEDISNMKEQLKLSKLGTYTFTESNGHNVQITEPQVVVDEIKWVLNHVAA
jgi:pimeloyl-ACP methyl ester carboxylesterase